MVIRQVTPSKVLFVSKNTEMGNGKQNDLKPKDVLFLRTDPKTGRETVQIQKSKKRNKRKQRRCARCNKMSCAVVMLVCMIISYLGYQAEKGNFKKPQYSRLMDMLIKMLKRDDSNDTDKHQPYLDNIGLASGDPQSLRDCYGPYMKQSFPDLDYALFGYNILRAYPLANGHDPGFTIPIFEANYDQLLHTADCRFSIPQGMTVVPDVSCVTSFTSRTVQNSFEFSESLSMSAEVSGGGWGVEFSASAGYKESTSTMGSGESLFIISEARCNYYFSKMDPIKPPPFHSSFISQIVKLNDAENEEDFFYFFNHYGTHFPTSVTFGARYTHKHKMSSSTYKTEKSRGINVAAQASFSGSFQVGGGFSMDASQREAAQSFQQKVETKTITVGAPPPSDGNAMTWASTVKETPVPMAYKLESIENLFTDTYMAGYDFDYPMIHYNISQLKYKYCESLRKSGETDSCEDMIPYIAIKGKKINEWAGMGWQWRNNGDSVYGISKSSCINTCLHDDLCIEAEYTEGVDLCEMNQPGQGFNIFSNAKATLMIFTAKLVSVGQNLVINNAKVIMDIPVRSKITEDIDLNKCRKACEFDIICAVFTYDSRGKKCLLYSKTALGNDETPIAEDDASRFITEFMARSPQLATAKLLGKGKKKKKGKKS